MKRALPLTLQFAVVAIYSLATAANAAAQIASSATPPETRAVLTKLYSPIYPAIARQARISGDVKVQVVIRKDGTIESADVVSGHLLLKQAALDSVQKSRFDCRGCAEAETSYSLTYTFQLPAETKPVPGCCTAGTQASADFEAQERRGPQVSQSNDHITITAGPTCLCPDSCPELEEALRDLPIPLEMQCSKGRLPVIHSIVPRHLK
ncbi:MAG TPA: energy transducer TonB [Candidatus Sulfotelmatobacter sp.]|nr:energy transducer TonB [Candidatus Sulfotelmatobacter sp.]